MARPAGSPKLGGRKKGIPNKSTAERVKKAQEIAESGITPLEYLLSVMRDTRNMDNVRIDAAKAAAPYIHPKLANIELNGKDGGPLQIQIVRFGVNSDPQ